MKVDPLLRRAAAALPADLAAEEPLKVRHAAEVWAIAVGQTARADADVEAARAAALELARLDEDGLRDAAESLSFPPSFDEPAAVRTLLAGLAEELERLIHPDDAAGPRRERGPEFVGEPLGLAFRRSFGAWLSWMVFDPYQAAQLAWGTAACAADLAGRLSDEERAEEAERLRLLVERWDPVSLLAIEKCTAGTWLESDAMEDALARALETLATHLAGPRPPRPPGPRPEMQPLSLRTPDWPVGMATRFDSSNAQLQAKRRGERLIDAERPPTGLIVDGKLFPNMVSYVVPAGPTLTEGFGDGVAVARDEHGRPRPGRAVGHMFKLRQARLIFAWDPPMAKWDLAAAYPTDEPPLLLT